MASLKIDPAERVAIETGAKHTPGPWLFREGDVRIRANGYEMVGFVYRADTPNGLANGLLVAAAPDLLDALKAARTYVVRSDFPGEMENRCVLKQIDAAIAKAEAR